MEQLETRHAPQVQDRRCSPRTGSTAIAPRKPRIVGDAAPADEAGTVAGILAASRRSA